MGGKMGRGERLIRTSGAKRWCVVMADSLRRMSRREEATCRWRTMGRKTFDTWALGLHGVGCWERSTAYVHGGMIYFAAHQYPRW